MNRGPRWRLPKPTSAYTYASVVGVSGYLGGLVAATQCDDDLAEVVRAAAIVFFLAMGVVREFLRRSGALDAAAPAIDWSDRNSLSRPSLRSK